MTETDARWFAKHPARKFRLRQVRPHEFSVKAFRTLAHLDEHGAIQVLPVGGLSPEAETILLRILQLDRPSADTYLGTLWTAAREVEKIVYARMLEQRAFLEKCETERMYTA